MYPDTPTVEYVSTQRAVDPSLLSENAQIMCGGLDIEWLTTSPTDTGEIEFLSHFQACKIRIFAHVR